MTTSVLPVGAPPRPGLIVLDGADRITGALAGLLTPLGTRVEVGPVAADAAELALRAGEPDAVPDLVVLSGPGWPPAVRWLGWRARGVPHLAIDHGSQQVRIGPLVLPGSPCLRCLELHHRDGRPARGPGATSAGQGPPDEMLAWLAAGATALIARNLLLHRRHLPGVGLDLALPDPCPRPQRWTVHPRCDGHPVAVTMEP